ncbi:MAG: serine hydrolase domain-containing protein, partial [Sphingobacteriia bacterium]
MRIPFILSLLLNICASIAFLQAQSVDSDPVRLGWMQGFPPPADKVVRAADGSFFRFPALRYSVCHMRSFLPTVAVPAATVSQPHTFFSVDDAAPSAIDTVQFLPIGSNKPMSWAASLEKNYTDGILVLHRGRIVYERYFGCLQPDGVHAVMSVSKTFAGTLGAMLVAEGVLDEHRTAASYVPALASSALGTATIRQLLDMTTGLKYSEDYSDPKAEVWAFSAAGNTMLAHPKDYQGPTNYYEYLATVQPQGTHGTAFAYKTINTDALGWVISVATGKPLATLLSERIWQPLGT